MKPVSLFARIRKRIYLPLAAMLLHFTITPILYAGLAPQQWTAQWIAAPGPPYRDYDVVYFRKTLSLPSVPPHLVVDASADTRFELHVNGARVGAGPALADVHHWRYEVYDLTPYLKPGTNVIAAIVWNFGTNAAIAQMSSQTAFLLSAEDGQNAAFNTGEGWEASRESGRTPVHESMRDYYAAAPPERMDGNLMQWDWDAAATSKSEWKPAMLLGHAAPAGAQDSPTRWILQKDELPPMLYTHAYAGRVVRATGTPELAIQPALEAHPFLIPAHAHTTILLDRQTLTTAFPSIRLDGGKNASVKVTFAEALYDAQGAKGNRDEIDGRHIEGVSDEIVADGAERTYRTLWWRTWRYLQLDIETSGEPLNIKSVDAFYTAYPFEAIAHFESDDPMLTRIWDTGWRTAQLCAHETYMDTPYWEQMQYVGDTRIQAIISYAVTGDDRLARQALMAYRDSMLTNGLTQSRYPSSLTQVIPPFSLMWIGMLHDYAQYRNDPAFVASLLPATRGVLDWFSARQRPDGLLGTIEWWPFVDWTSQYAGGVPPQDADGGSSALTLQFIEGLKDAAELERSMGESERAARYEERERRAIDALRRLNWDEQSGLLADTPAKKQFSQEANALAVWLDVTPEPQQRAVMERILQTVPSTIVMSQASYYFRFYLARAMLHAGLGDMYLLQLGPWKKMLDLGLSTWAETPEPTRSDSHAWSAHPTYDLLTIVAGIAPASSHFGSIRIEPHLGSLKQVAASMPTPNGMVSVRYLQTMRGWEAMITMPPHISGDFIWRGKSMPLHPGEQKFSLPKQ